MGGETKLVSYILDTKYFMRFLYIPRFKERKKDKFIRERKKYNHYSI